jgi:hypothetical protein
MQPVQAPANGHDVPRRRAVERELRIAGARTIDEHLHRGRARELLC